MTDAEPVKENTLTQDVAKPRITEATEKDWEDFFAVQEDLNYLFDR